MVLPILCLKLSSSKTHSGVVWVLLGALPWPTLMPSEVHIVEILLVGSASALAKGFAFPFLGVNMCECLGQCSESHARAPGVASYVVEFVQLAVSNERDIFATISGTYENTAWRARSQSVCFVVFRTASSTALSCSLHVAWQP